MKPLESLPDRPLGLSDVTQLRNDGTVDGFIELESRAHIVQNGGLERAVALVEGTVVGLVFENGAWTREVLARDADERRHLDEALDYLDGH